MFRRFPHFLAPFLVYPAINYGGGAVLIAGTNLGHPPGLLSVPLLLVTLGIAVFLERLLPFQRDWLRPRGDLDPDLLHGLAGHLRYPFTARSRA